jgi:allene oxide cyclase
MGTRATGVENRPTRIKEAGMKGLLALVVAAAGAALVLAVAATGTSSAGRTIWVVEHATTDAITNPGTGGQADNVGDILTFANQVFNRSDSRLSGRDQGYCVRMVVGAAWECTWTTYLAPGSISVQGPFYDTRNSKLAITGGTGAYADAGGWMQLRSKAGGAKYDFVFHLNS